MRSAPSFSRPEQHSGRKTPRGVEMKKTRRRDLEKTARQLRILAGSVGLRINNPCRPRGNNEKKKKKKKENKRVWYLTNCGADPRRRSNSETQKTIGCRFYACVFRSTRVSCVGIRIARSMLKKTLRRVTLHRFALRCVASLVKFSLLSTLSD